MNNKKTQIIYKSVKNLFTDLKKYSYLLVNKLNSQFCIQIWAVTVRSQKLIKHDIQPKYFFWSGNEL